MSYQVGRHSNKGGMIRREPNKDSCGCPWISGGLDVEWEFWEASEKSASWRGWAPGAGWCRHCLIIVGLEKRRTLDNWKIHTTASSFWPPKKIQIEIVDSDKLQKEIINIYKNIWLVIVSNWTKAKYLQKWDFKEYGWWTSCSHISTVKNWCFNMIVHLQLVFILFIVHRTHGLRINSVVVPKYAKVRITTNWIHCSWFWLWV